jgi:hypothetical protein
MHNVEYNGLEKCYGRKKKELSILCIGSQLFYE